MAPCRRSLARGEWRWPTKRLFSRSDPWRHYVSLRCPDRRCRGRGEKREREEGALDGLLVAPLARSALFVGKLAGVLTFLLLIGAVVIPLAALFFSIDLARRR